MTRLLGTGQLGHHLAAPARGGAAGAQGGKRPVREAGRLRLGFWSADWTPWPAFLRLREAWPALRFDVRPRYDDAGWRRADPNPEVQRLLGGTGEFGAALGLDAAWARNAIRAVGNSAEVWERNLSPLGMERGPNRLWRDGGLFYAPPFR